MLVIIIFADLYSKIWERYGNGQKVHGFLGCNSEEAENNVSRYNCFILICTYLPPLYNVIEIKHSLHFAMTSRSY